jgi:uncharacterized membrane protein YgdD (TMEM256/DUF423 family)
MKNSITVGALLMSLAVVLGAFGSHGLKNIVSNYSVEIYNKAVYYQVIHSLGILVTAIILKDEKSLRILRILFLTGIVGFSGSLYMLTFADVLPEVLKKIIGPITPIGGMFFVASWVYFAMAFRKETNN